MLVSVSDVFTPRGSVDSELFNVLFFDQLRRTIERFSFLVQELFHRSFRSNRWRQRWTGHLSESVLGLQSKKRGLNRQEKKKKIVYR